MPYADPDRSFDAAVKHLFRHINDARALHRNPLVRERFAKFEKKKSGQAFLAAVRGQILHLTALQCSQDARSGFERRARRRHAIVAAICAAEPVAKTAARLKLSRRQYYRERRAICQLVAGSMSRPQRTAVAVDDARVLLFNRAASLRDQGLARSAVVLLDGALAGVAPGDDRFLARLELADALVELGDVARADKLLTYARREAGDETAISSRARDRAILSEARHAFATGTDAEAGRALDALANRQMAENLSDATAFETLIECGNWHCANARFSQARRVLRRARTVAARLAHLTPAQHVGIELLHAYCAEDFIGASDGSRSRFQAALDLSAANASMRGTLEATIGLMGYCGSIGCDDAAYDFAVRALEIARAMEGRRHVIFAAAWIATTLLKTRYRRVVEPLLCEAERFARPGTLHWVFLKEAHADLLARTAQYDAAYASFAQARDAAQILQNRKWQAIVYRDLGLMLNRLGNREGAGSIKRAVELAEEGAVGAWTLSLIYRAASKVLSDKEIARRARRMETALRASAAPPLQSPKKPIRNLTVRS